ncbi:tetratricopeptide repeat protein [Baekduia sp. Peel2402]|uniref:tetratricopeptide repeat protein n=1 Tax=Baekduia sp. Peel2402 TaxID=3458296 RepID=UPI00403E7A7D
MLLVALYVSYKMWTDESASVGQVAPSDTPSVRLVGRPSPPLTLSDQMVIGEFPGQPPGFFDRPEVEQLARSLSESTVATLSGGRGSGKTQVAAEHAHRAIAAGVGLVAWINAGDEASLLAGLATVAQRLAVADPSDDLALSAMRLRETLATGDVEAVFVLDDATSPSLIRRYLPSSGATRWIITSTDRAFGSMGTELVVAELEREQSVAYLAARTGFDDLVGANAVADALGDLPLALAQAAAVIRLRGFEYTDYLKLLDEVPLREALPAHRGDPYPRALAAAIVLTIEAIERSAPSIITTRALQAIALLSEDGVRRRTIERVVGGGTHHLNAVLGQLVEASLIVWSRDREAVIMHRLVSRSVRERLQDANHLDPALANVAERLTPLMPDHGRAWQVRDDAAEIVRHSLTLWRRTLHSVERGEVSAAAVRERWSLFNWALSHLLSISDGSGSRPSETAATTCDALTRILGPADPITLKARNMLAYAHRTRGDLTAAVPMFEANLDDASHKLGQRHPDALIAADNLATTYIAAGRLHDAIALLQQILPEREALHGRWSAQALMTLGHLADAHVEAGDLARGHELLCQTVAGREKVLGKDHPDTLTARQRLARLLPDLDRADEAIEMLTTLLPISERVRGKSHPDTVMTQVDLGRVLSRCGLHGRALPLLRAGASTSEKTLGGENPQTLKIHHTLAVALLDAGRTLEGRPLIDRVVADCRRLLGANDPETIRAVTHLATALRDAGKPSRAVALLEKNAVRCKRVLGPGHPHTFSARLHLAGSQHSMGWLKQAREGFRTLLTDVERDLGPDHPIARNARANLAALGGQAR